MTPLESALFVLIVILVIFLLILCIGFVILFFALKQIIVQINKILGNVDGFTTDIGSNIRLIVRGLAMIAKNAGKEQLKKIFSRNKSK